MHFVLPLPTIVSTSPLPIPVPRSQALRAALDPRVFVATGRALWDCMGKDLFEFVHFLQVSPMARTTVHYCALLFPFQSFATVYERVSA